MIVSAYTPVSLLVFFLLATGCTGQNLEGSWNGPFPMYGASDCRIRIRVTGYFDLSCRGPEEYVGAGKWRQRGDNLQLEFLALAEYGAPVRRLPPPIRFYFLGRGNRLELRPEDSRDTLVWERRMD